jgi:two-component system, sensor histidine kinase and response regulator
MALAACLSLSSWSTVRDGSHELSCWPDVDQYSEVLGMYVLVTDVTQLKETELRLHEASDALRRALERAKAIGR